MPWRRTAPADRLLALERDIALHFLCLRSIAGHVSVSLRGALRPLDYVVVLIKALAVARRPLRVVGEGAAIEELEEVWQRLRRELRDGQTG